MKILFEIEYYNYLYGKYKEEHLNTLENCI